MNKITCFLLSQGIPSDLYFIDRIIGLIKESKDSWFEIYVFEIPGSEFLFWKELFLKILKSLDMDPNIKIYEGMNLFFEKTTQGFCLSKKIRRVEEGIRFYSLFFPLLIDSYIGAHRGVDKKHVFFCNKELKNFLKYKDDQNNKFVLIKDQFINLRWDDLLKRRKEFNLGLLDDNLDSIYLFWKSLKGPTLNIESKQAVKTFLEGFSNSLRQDIFYIVVEDEGITARKIQNKLKYEGNSISLPAILKHLDELIKVDMVYKKEKSYFPKCKRLRIVMVS